MRGTGNDNYPLIFRTQSRKLYSLTYELNRGILSYPTRALTWIKKLSFNCCVCLLFFEFLVCETRSFWYSHSISRNLKVNTIDILVEELLQYRSAVGYNVKTLYHKYASRLTTWQVDISWKPDGKVILKAILRGMVPDNMSLIRTIDQKPLF